MKKCPTSVIVNERQIKTTMRYYLTPIRMAVIKKKNNNRCWRGCGKTETHTVGGNIYSYSHYGKHYGDFSKKTKNRTIMQSSNLTTGYFSERKGISILNGYLHPQVYCSTIHSSKDIEST